MEESLIIYAVRTELVHTKHLPRPRPHLPHALCRG